MFQLCKQEDIGVSSSRGLTARNGSYGLTTGNDSRYEIIYAGTHSSNGQSRSHGQSKRYTESQERLVNAQQGTVPLGREAEEDKDQYSSQCPRPLSLCLSHTYCQLQTLSRNIVFWVLYFVRKCHASSLWSIILHYLFIRPLYNNSSGTIYPIAGGGDKWVHAFRKGINPKVNAISRLKFELAYYVVAVKHVNHYAMRIPPSMLWPIIKGQ